MMSNIYINLRLPNGEICKVNEDDLVIISGYSWHKVGGYVQAETGSRVVGDRKHIRMHRLIMNAKEGELIDHKNGNPLDNRRRNLRVCTQSQNGMNRKAQANNKSGYKGVSWMKTKNKWRATITVNKVQIHLGLFSSKLGARRAYNHAANLYHGQFANHGN